MPTVNAGAYRSRPTRRAERGQALPPGPIPPGEASDRPARRSLAERKNPRWESSARLGMTTKRACLEWGGMDGEVRRVVQFSHLNNGWNGAPNRAFSLSMESPDVRVKPRARVAGAGFGRGQGVLRDPTEA